MSNSSDPYASQDPYQDPYQNPYSQYNTPGSSDSDFNRTPPPPIYDSGYATPNPYSDATPNPYAEADSFIPPAPPPSVGAYSSQPSMPYATPQRRGRSWACSVVSLLLLLLICGGLGVGGYYAYGAISKSIASTALPNSGINNSGGGNGGNGPTTVTISSGASIIVDRNDGPIHVKVGSSQNTVSIQAIDTNNSPVSQAIPYSENSDHTAFTFDTSNFETDNLQLAVPASIGLDLKTNDGDITVNGVTGKLALSSNGGSIFLSDATASRLSSFSSNGGALQLIGVKLTGSSTLSTNAGNITFKGSLDRNSTYKIDSNGGTIDLTLPGSSSFHANLSTNGSTVTCTFPGIQVSSDGTQAQGDAGSPPRATLTVTNNSGAIKLQQG